MSQPQSSGYHGAREHEHVLPLQLYFKIFGALVFLTGLTVLVSYLNLGPNAVLAAMAVAVIKGGLVVGFFMHLKFDNRFNLLVLLGALSFLILFFLFTFIDLESRGNIIPEQDTFYLRHERQKATKAKEKEAELAAKAASAAAAKAKAKPAAPAAKPVTPAPKAAAPAPKAVAPKPAAPTPKPATPTGAKPAAPPGAPPGAPKPVPQ